MRRVEVAVSDLGPIGPIELDLRPKVRADQDAHVAEPAFETVRDLDTIVRAQRQHIEGHVLKPIMASWTALPPSTRIVARSPVRHIETGEDRYVVAVNRRYLDHLLLRALCRLSGAA